MLEHGNNMTPTKAAARAVRQPVLPMMNSPAKNEDAQGKAALTNLKEKDVREDNIKAGASQGGEVITPPSSGERKNPTRKTKVYTNYADFEEDLGGELVDGEEFEAYDAQSPIDPRGNKRKHNAKTSSSGGTKPSPSKRLRMEHHAPKPQRPESEMTEQEKEVVMNMTYTNLDDVAGFRPSQHGEIMKKMFGGFEKGRAMLRPNLHSYVPDPESLPARITLPPIVDSRNGVPRKMGDKLMEEVQDTVRRNLVERYGWQFKMPAIVSSSMQALSIH